MPLNRFLTDFRNDFAIPPRGLRRVLDAVGTAAVAAGGFSRVWTDERRNTAEEVPRMRQNGVPDGILGCKRESVPQVVFSVCNLQQRAESYVFLHSRFR